MNEDPQRDEVTADTAIGKFSVTGKDLNLIFTILTTIAAFVIAIMLYHHLADTDAVKEQFQELIRVHKEQTCLLTYKEEERERRIEYCRRMSQ